MLIDRIRTNFEFLFKDYDFVPSKDEEENNDWVVVLILGLIRLRFIEDRANLFLDVGLISEPNVWHEFGTVLSLVKERQNIENGFRVYNNDKSLKTLLIKYLEPLVVLVKDDEFREAVSSLKSI